MIAQLSGNFLALTPTLLILDVQGVGYELHISLHTYTALQGKQQAWVHTYLKVSEDSMALYGFADAEEKDMFIRLIGISGVGASTARMMLSSMKPAEIAAAIHAGDARQLERIKGIGKKTAERLVLELRDKIIKPLPGSLAISAPLHNTIWSDALEALMALGIQRGPAEVAVKKIQSNQPETASVEEIIKQVLKSL
jgi:Holliday junction DNA helicase RuvA